MSAQPIPILAYHAVADPASSSVGRFAVSPSLFAEHLECLCAQGFVALTVSQLVDIVRREGGGLPPRPVALTFDDGYADFYHQALPLLERRGLTATVYATTGFLEGGPVTQCAWRPQDRMLSWPQLSELVARGIEVGGHSHTHPELDTLPPAAVRYEVASSKALLEDGLGSPVRSFAYPYGYATPLVRQVVREVGYESACGVKHALSSTADDLFWLARLEVTAATSSARLADWLAGRGLRMAPCPDRLQARVWRPVRLVRAAARRRLEQNKAKSATTLSTARTPRQRRYPRRSHISPRTESQQR